MVGWKVHGLLSSYDDVISAADDFFDQWDLGTAKQKEDVCGPEAKTILKDKPHLI